MEALSLGKTPAGKWQNWSVNWGCLAPKSMILMTAQYCKVEKELIIIL